MRSLDEAVIAQYKRAEQSSRTSELEIVHEYIESE